MPIYKTHLGSSKLCNVKFSQACMCQKSYASTKNHLINAFSLKLTDHNLTSLSSLLDDCTCSCFMKLSYSCCTTSTCLMKFTQQTILQVQSRAERRKHKDSTAEMLNSLHQPVDFTRELCIPRPLKLASHVISRKPEVLNVLKICFVVIDHSLPQ